MPILFLLWLLAWVDRANISFAKLQMLSDLHFGEAVYGFGAGLFFLGYVVFGVPATLIQQKVGAKRMISGIVIGWSLTSLAMMTVTSRPMFYALRFLLGMFEAGFYPGVILYMNSWFPRARMTRNFSIFHSAAILSPLVIGMTGAAIMTNMNGVLSLAGWRWMFLLQAAPTLLIGCIALVYLPNGPASASWLSEHERSLVQADVARDREAQGAQEVHATTGSLLSSPLIWTLIAAYFCILTANSAIAFFIPTILREAGFGSYTAIGNAVALICIFGAAGNIAFCTFASRFPAARYFCAFASLAGAASLCWLVLIWHSDKTMTFIALVLANAGTGAGISMFWQIPPRYLPPAVAAFGIALISSAANLAGFLTPWLIGYVREVSHTYSSGFLVAAGVQATAAVVLLVLLPLAASRKAAREARLAPGTNRSVIASK
jgi:MFS family permease